MHPHSPHTHTHTQIDVQHHTDRVNMREEETKEEVFLWVKMFSIYQLQLRLN